MLYMRKQIMSVQINMNIDTERLKERMIALIDERDRLYVIPLLDDLENAIHEYSFDSGYETWYDIGLVQ